MGIHNGFPPGIGEHILRIQEFLWGILQNFLREYFPDRFLKSFLIFLQEFILGLLQKFFFKLIQKFFLGSHQMFLLEFFKVFLLIFFHEILLGPVKEFHFCWIISRTVFGNHPRTSSKSCLWESLGIVLSICSFQLFIKVLLFPFFSKPRYIEELVNLFIIFLFYFVISEHVKQQQNGIVQ